MYSFNITNNRRFLAVIGLQLLQAEARGHIHKQSDEDANDRQSSREKVEASVPRIVQLYGVVVEVAVHQAGQDRHKRLDAGKHCKYLQIYKINLH